MRNNPEEPAYLIESVDNALRLLLLLLERKELRVTDVSDELGVARSTAHRLLTTMAHRGFVEQDRASRSYRAGRAIVEIGLAAMGELDIRRKARHHMLDLAAELDETVNLLVLEGAGVRFIDGVESSQPLRVTSRTGTLLPAHSTSGGKLLLSELPEPELDEVLDRALRQLTDETMTDRRSLREELSDARRLGYALNRQESEEGLNAVAVCIRDRSGRAIAALAVSVPAFRGSADRLRSMVPPLTETATAIGQEL